MLSSAGGSCRAALGSINFIAYFYNPPLCMHPPSHPIASALTVHTAVKFRVSPCFMVACSSSHSRFLYLLLFWYPSLHLCIFSKLLVALVDGVVCFFSFRCEKDFRLHTDNMWTCIPMWVHNSIRIDPADLWYLCFTTDTMHGLRTRRTKRGSCWQGPLVIMSGNQSCCSCRVWRESHWWPVYNPHYSCSKPTRPFGSALLLSLLVHSAQQSANKV